MALKLVSSMWDVSRHVSSYASCAADRFARYISDAREALAVPYEERVVQSKSLDFSPSSRGHALQQEIDEIESSMKELAKLHAKAVEARYLTFAILNPVYRMPTELLLVIFALSLPEFGHSCGSGRAPQWHQEYTTVYTLRLVCKQWNVVLLQCPDYFAKIGLGFFTKPRPEGPWKSEESFPWEFFQPNQFSFNCTTLEFIDNCVPFEAGPASNYDISFSAAAAEFARLSQSSGPRLIDLDLRNVSDRLIIQEVIVSLSRYHKQWGTLLLDGFCDDSLSLLDTIADGDHDITSPFVKKDDLQAFTRRLTLREQLRQEGFQPPNGFVSLHTLLVRDRRFRPDKLQWTSFIQNLSSLRHLSIGDVFYWSRSDMASAKLPFGGLETLELVDIRSWRSYSYILGASSRVVNLIIRINGMVNRPLGSTPSTCVLLSSVKNLVYENKTDGSQRFFKYFGFPGLEKLSITSYILYNTNAWLASPDGEHTIAALVLGRGTVVPSIHRLLFLELFHLAEADLATVKRYFLDYYKNPNHETKDEAEEIISGLTLIHKLDNAPASSRFLTYSSKERKAF